MLGAVAVAGATGRTGRLVVSELLRSGKVSEVVALVRNVTKAEEVLGVDVPGVRVVPWDSDSEEMTRAACVGVEAVIWCAEGKTGLPALGSILAGLGEREGGQPRLVMCSTAALTRPTWSAAKQRRFEGAADIPIVRLNPNDILGGKRAAEDLVRASGASYTIVRPTGLNDRWPPGRPVLSQGDFAVGRTSRADLASLLASLLFEPESTGKTFEALSVAGYPKPRSGYAQALAPLRRDADRRAGPLGALRRAASWLLRGEPPGADAATYGLLQQLLPGEEQNSAALAMGQTYEQYDRGQQGRLGARGEERVPASITR